MNTDYDVETLADILFEALSLSSSIRRQAGSDSELGRLMQRIHQMIESTSREVSEFQVQLEAFGWCATCNQMSVEISGDEPFCHACEFNYDRRAERV